METNACFNREDAINCIIDVIKQLPIDKRKLAINEIHKISQEPNQFCMPKNTYHTPA